MPSSAYVCILLLIVGTVPISAKSSCTSSTCLNGGKCDLMYEGPGVRCLCPGGSMSDYGPLCELYTRSYTSVGPYDGKNFAATWYDIPNLDWRKNNERHVSIAFDFIGECSESRCPIFVANDGNGETQLILELLRNGQLSLSLMHKTKIHTKPEPYLQLVVPQNVSDLDHGWHGHWRSAKLFTNPSAVFTNVNHFQGVIVYCSRKTRLCASAANKKWLKGIADNFRSKLKIKVGHGLNGCIRNLVVDTRHIDMSKVARVDGDPSRTRPGCSAQEASCVVGRPASKVASPICGRNSACFGVIPHLSREADCECRCTNGKIRERETVSNALSCTVNGRPNACTKDPPILSMGSKNYLVQWTLNSDQEIPHNSYQTGKTNKATLSIELEFKTRWRQYDPIELIKIFHKDQRMSIELDTANRVRFLYRGWSFFHQGTHDPFDGDWHHVSMSIRGRAVFLTVDNKLLSYPFFDLKYYSYFSVQVGAPHACFRNIRVGDIYMPVGYGDPTADNSSYYIKMHEAEGAVASYECNNDTIAAPFKEPTRPPPPIITTHAPAAAPAAAPAHSTAQTANATSTTNSRVCDCTDLEDCVTFSDRQECLCKVGLYRDHSGLCSLDPRLQKVLDEMASTGPAASVHGSAGQSLHFLSVLLLICCRL